MDYTDLGYPLAAVKSRPRIDYRIIDDAIRFYEEEGFTYIETPWVSPISTIARTLPEDAGKGYHWEYKAAVGSAEQGFLDLMERGKLKENTDYVSCGPCFRDENTSKIDPTFTYHTFFKAELFRWTTPEKDSDPRAQNRFSALAARFYRRYFDNHIIKVEPEEMEHSHTPTNDLGVCIDVNSNLLKPYDLDPGLDPKEAIANFGKWVELGSYGTRMFTDINSKIYYGTGVAEPRFSKTLRIVKPDGYHKDIIPKAYLRTPGKILEEAREFEDAVRQGNPIMELVELSDLYLTITDLVRDRYNMTIENIVKMAETTKRAWVNGRRK